MDVKTDVHFRLKKSTIRKIKLKVLTGDLKFNGDVIELLVENFIDCITENGEVVKPDPAKQQIQQIDTIGTSKTANTNTLFENFI